MPLWSSSHANDCMPDDKADICRTLTNEQIGSILAAATIDVRDPRGSYLHIGAPPPGGGSAPETGLAGSEFAGVAAFGWDFAASVSSGSCHEQPRCRGRHLHGNDLGIHERFTCSRLKALNQMYFGAKTPCRVNPFVASRY